MESFIEGALSVADKERPLAEIVLEVLKAWEKANARCPDCDRHPCECLLISEDSSAGEEEEEEEADSEDEAFIDDSELPKKKKQKA